MLHVLHLTTELMIVDIDGGDEHKLFDGAPYEMLLYYQHICDVRVRIFVDHPFGSGQSGKVQDIKGLPIYFLDVFGVVNINIRGKFCSKIAPDEAGVPNKADVFNYIRH